MRTIQELAKEVLDIQNSDDLVEIAWLFSQALLELKEIFKGTPQEGKEHLHEISILYSGKIATLTRSEVHGAIADAYFKTMRLSK